MDDVWIGRGGRDVAVMVWVGRVGAGTPEGESGKGSSAELAPTDGEAAGAAGTDDHHQPTGDTQFRRSVHVYDCISGQADGASLGHQELQTDPSRAVWTDHHGRPRLTLLAHVRLPLTLTHHLLLGGLLLMWRVLHLLSVLGRSLYDHLSVWLDVRARGEPSSSRSAWTHLARHRTSHRRRTRLKLLPRLRLLKMRDLMLLLLLLWGELLTWEPLLAWLGMIRMLSTVVQRRVGVVHRAHRSTERGIKRG